MDVWVVLADYGNSQEAEEEVDSVWSTSDKAHARAESMVTPRGARVSIQTLDPMTAAGRYPPSRADMTHRTYTAEVAPEFADQFSEWRPITDVADEFKIVTHEDGIADLLFRVKPKDTNVVHLSTNGAGEPK